MQRDSNAIRKLLKNENVYYASETPEVEVIPTGIVSLDYKLGKGGIPRGRLVEIYGRESTGKSALTYYMMAEVQRRGGSVGLINVEGTFDPSWAKRISGLQLNTLVTAVPPHGPAAVDMMIEWVNSNGFDMIVFDSIGAMIGEKERQAGNAKQAGGQSAMVTRMINSIIVPADANKTTCVFVNQVRDDFDAYYPTEKAPGGHARDHGASIRVHLKPGPKREGAVEKIDGEEVQVMYRVNAKIVKNKIGAPNQSTGWNFWNYDSPHGVIGIDRTQDLIDLALATGVVARAGAWYRHEVFPEGQLQGAPAVSDFLRGNEDAYEVVREALMQHMKDKEAEVKPERETLTDGSSF